MQKVERQITLCQIDRCWSDHLSHVAEIREGIHLVSIGGLNAFDEFNRQVNAAFRDLSRHIEDEVLATLRTVRDHPRRRRFGQGRAARPLVDLDLYDQRQPDGRHPAKAAARNETAGEWPVVTLTLAIR